jgi:hypothetical protein
MECHSKHFALKKLARSIQEGKGHDSLEDAIAARDLVHSYIMSLSGPRGKEEEDNAPGFRV